ncbi:helix-turn-helix domain-containing protein [Deinococcus sp. SL84]|uniref:helix-turn-helix domain-containing protein n=1 Tax=Deinococcus sp. SL84 TaxID=2994663 RepID=UPI0022745157|nr:helix-turn-helix transcriptional regulator [Deinococcus sp. SL84]MCY1703654.1 helix-turn-helix transcriptional regulator [Deinococcus sp. SL84]
MKTKMWESSPERDRDGILESKTVGRFFKARIKEKGLSYTQLADKLGITPSYLSHLLAGRNNIGRSIHFKPLVAELGLSPEEIEHINPNVIIVSPEALDSKPEPPAELPPELLAAMSKVHRMGLAQAVTEANLPYLLPRGLDGKGPKTEADWMKYLVLVDDWFR